MTRETGTMTQIVTERLRLEPVTERNADALWRVMQSAHLREFQDVPHFTVEEFSDRVARRPKRLHSRAIGRFEWLVMPTDDEEAAGWVSLRLGDHAPGVAELGYSLLAQYRHRGWAAEAARALVDLAFSTSDIVRVEACCVPENLASRRLLERVGFVQLRLQRNGAIVRGKPVDIVVYQVVRERWRYAEAFRGNTREQE